MANFDIPIDNDYSQWEVLFDRKIASVCPDRNSFFSDVTFFGDSISRRIFSSFSSDAGVARLTASVRDGTLVKYLGFKSGLIVFWFFAIIVCIVSLALAFSMLKSCRKACCRSMCKDRSRKRIEEKRPWFTLLVATVCVLCLFTLAICFWIYSSQVIKAKNVLVCDVWQSLKGHYFGVRSVEMSPAIVKNWTGSQGQRKAMIGLGSLVFPRPEGGGVCRLCESIVNNFNGTEESLLAKLSRNSAMLAHKIELGVIGHEIFVKIMKHAGATQIERNNRYNAFTSALYSVWDNLDGLVGESAKLDKALTNYNIGLTQSLTRGGAMLDDKISKALGRNSPMLMESYMTAESSVVAIADVDYVMAGVVKKFDKMSSMISAVFTVVTVLTIFMGVVAFAIIGLTLFITIKTMKARKAKLPVSNRVVSAAGVLFAVVIVSSGASILLSAVTSTVGNIGSDGCGFIDTVAFEGGNWGVLPPELWNKTISNRTDIRSVLNTCVTKSGDGDIAGTLGLRMALNRLEADVVQMEELIMKSLDEHMGISERIKRADALASMVLYSIYNAAATPLKGITLANSYNQFVESAGLYQNRFSPFGDIPNKARTLCILPAFISGGTLLQIFLDGLTWCFPSPIIVAKSSGDALADLNRIVEKARHRNPDIKFTRFCFKYQEMQRICTIDDEVPKLPSTRDSSKYILETDWKTPEVVKFLETLDEKEDAEDIKTAVGALDMMIHYDTFLLEPISKFEKLGLLRILNVNISSLFPQKGETNEIDIYEALESLYPEMKGRSCDLNSTENCSFFDYLRIYRSSMEDLSRAIANGPRISSKKIADFIHNTTGLFKIELETAKKNLKEFNCQYVGTSLKHGARSALCNGVLPGTATLGIVCLLIWGVCLIGSIASWKVYHYYSNLNALPNASFASFAARGDDDGSETHAKINKLLSS